MKSRDQGGRTGRGVDGRTRDGITALVGFGLAVVAAFGACKLDDKNPALPDEAPNRGQFVGGIAIGAGPGTGGSGAGLGSGGSAGGTTTTVPIPADCECAAAFITDSECQLCVNSLCGMEETACTNDATCQQELNAFQGCSDAPCVAGAIDNGGALFLALINCGCGQCPSGQSTCITSTISCP